MAGVLAEEKLVGSSFYVGAILTYSCFIEKNLNTRLGLIFLS